MRNALIRANAIVADSKATADDVEDFLPSVGHRINVIYPGLTQLSPKVVETTDPSERYALFVGTLEPRKNLRRILEAFSSLPPAVSANMKLVIAGGQGWRMGNLSDLIMQLGLREKVVLEGHVSNSRLATLYASAEFLLMPSLYEGFGFPIIEAQSFGIPVITSNISSMPEVAGDGAIFVNPTSVDEIRAAVQALATQPDVKTQLGIKARRNSERFTWQQSADQLSTIFQDLRAKSAQRPASSR
jgi:glycosyltransferase involved in cell wall biosynthesis